MPRDLTSGTEPPSAELQPLYATYTDPRKRLRAAFRHVNKPVHMALSPPSNSRFLSHAQGADATLVADVRPVSFKVNLLPGS